MDNILQPVSHTTVPKPVSPSPAVVMTSKAVRKTQDITCTFDKFPADKTGQ